MMSARNAIGQGAVSSGKRSRLKAETAPMTYSLAGFIAKYSMDIPEGRRLFDAFGPLAVDLDSLMAAKRRLDFILDRHFERRRGAPSPASLH